MEIYPNGAFVFREARGKFYKEEMKLARHSHFFLSSFFLTASLLGGCGKKMTEEKGVAVTIANQANPGSYFEGQPGKVSLWKRGQGYDCAVFIPQSYQVSGDQRRFPMILSLHGYNGRVLNTQHTNVGGNRMGFIKQVWDTPLAQEFEGIVIAPHVYPVGETENRLWDKQLLRELILEAIETFNIDPNRIVVTGLSAGGIATQELLKYSKDLLAGGMSGAFQYLYQKDVCQFAQTPTWAFGNEADSVFDAGSWKKLNAEIQNCPNYRKEFKLSIYRNNCGHGCWDEHWAQPSVQEWLIGQER